MALPRKPKISPLSAATPLEPPISATPVVPETPEQTSGVPEPKPTRLLATGWSLLEPHDQVWFVASKPREVYHITKWMQAQIDAGLLKIV